MSHTFRQKTKHLNFEKEQKENDPGRSKPGHLSCAEKNYGNHIAQAYERRCVMAYRLKTNTSSRTGMQSSSRFWNSHSSVSVKDRTLEGSGIPLDFREGKVALSAPENHCMICAASGKGKTRRVLYPAVVMSAKAGRSIVIADMKGEIYRNTSEEVRHCGHEIVVINLRDPEKSDRFSPLSLVQRYWNNGDHSRATILLKDICAIVTEKLHSERDKFWETAAQDAIAGFALLLLEKGAPLTFENIHSLFNEYLKNKDDRSMYNFFFDTKAESYKRLSTILNLEAESTLSCVVSEFNAAISSLIDQKSIRDLLSCSDIDLRGIGEKPTAVYIVCPDESASLYGIASLFVEQCYSELVAHADSRDDNRLPVKVDFILDEFGSFVGSNWPGKLTAARSRGIRFVLAIQAMSQLVARYDDSGARTIMSNCRTLIFMGGRDMRLLSEISMLSGTRKEEKSSNERPVLSINDLSTLSMGEVVVLDDSGLPYIGHLPDWTEWKISRGTVRWRNARTEEKTADAVSLRELLNPSENTSQNDAPEMTFPVEKSEQRDMMIQYFIHKLDSDPEFEEQLQRIMEEKLKPEERTVEIYDDDEFPF